jgi:hypothetical protein
LYRAGQAMNSLPSALLYRCAIPKEPTMRIKLLFLFALFSQVLFSQTITRLEENLEKKDFALFKHFIQDIKPSDNCATPDETTYREILNGYYEVVAKILIFEPTPNGKYEGDCNYYQINLLINDNLIIKYSLYKKHFNDNDLEDFQLLKDYSNNTEVKDFEDLYEKIFYRRVKIAELFENSVTYGDHCGIAGTNPKDRDVLEEYINSGNRAKLFYWLTSPNFERKLYGYEGFKALENKGYKLNEKETEIVSNLKNLKGFVRTCSGCSFMSEGFSEIVSQINGRKFEAAMSKQELRKSADKKTNSSPFKLALIGLSILLVFGLAYKTIKR